ncbi:SDR family oxidoreductase [Plantactinospora sonchi]|uniref:SDR family oxidoreductase n=1 Tax=Plantactinospora sonchi TaxID=1544735 RepID=A0ABU7RW54_9ACTN
MNSTAPQSDRVVAVTGAGTGIGQATARAFAVEGAHVVAIGRRSEPLTETAAGHHRITPLPVDITAEGGPEQIARWVSETFGRLDVLVNNAGVVRSGTLGMLTRRLIAVQVATNLVAPILLTQATLPLLETAGGVGLTPEQMAVVREWQLAHCGRGPPIASVRWPDRAHQDQVHCHRQFRTSTLAAFH